jgi:O-methyltransferase
VPVEDQMAVKSDLAQKYIELLKSSLLDDLYIENEYRIITAIIKLFNHARVRYEDLSAVDRTSPLFQDLSRSKSKGNILLIIRQALDGSTRVATELRNYTELAHTMIGRMRLDNMQYCIEKVLQDTVAGDLIEAGVWRGGATIFMRGVLAAYGIEDRDVWVADSFQGVPPPTYPQDAGLDLSANVFPFLSVGRDAVAELFQRYALLDSHVRFLPGWFKDTLPTAPIAALSILRLDGDLYESTMDALNPLYAKVSPGGFVIVDDYNSCPPCKLAVDEFRNTRHISDELVRIDDQSVFWRKS